MGNNTLIAKASSEAKIMAKMNAFYLFKNEGLERVAELFPDEKDFVVDNEHKSYEEVKKDLLSELKSL